MRSLIVHSFIDGLKCSLEFNKVVLLLTRSRATRWCLLKTVLINSILWSGGWLLFHGYTGTGPIIFGLPSSFILSHSLYFICLCINSLLFDQLGKETIQFLQRGMSSAISNHPTITSSTYSIIFYGNCALMIKVVRLIPYIGNMAGIPLTSIMMAYYCFEYKWIDLGWTQEHRLSFVEYHWPYFLGFGFPLTLATFFFSTLRAGAVFSFAFPTFVIIATLNMMAPKMDKSHSIPRLPVFFGLRVLNKFAFALIQAGPTRFFDRLMAQDRKDTLGKLV